MAQERTELQWLLAVDCTRPVALLLQAARSTTSSARAPAEWPPRPDWGRALHDRPIRRGAPGLDLPAAAAGEYGGVPLAVTLTGGNRNDVTQLIPLVEAVPPIRGRRGRPRRRPRELFADCGYDHDIYRRRLRARGITPRIARRGVAFSLGLGKQRWMVERSFA